MDSLKTPDLDHLDKSQTEKLNAGKNSGHAESSIGSPGSEQSTFMPGGVKINPKTVKPMDGEDLVEQFATKSTRDAKKRGEEAQHLDRGVLFRGSYISRRNVIKTVIIVTLTALFILFFAPPYIEPNAKMSACRYEDIFAEKGSSQYKADLMSTKYVYNIGAMSSDVSESYRICTVAFDVHNYLPIPLEVGDYIIRNGGEFSDHIVYAYADEDAKLIPSMSIQTIYVNILINKAGLTDGEFDRAITSLKLTTKGMKKLGAIPCIPAFMHVDESLTFDANVI